VALQQEILDMVRGFVGADVAVDQPLVAQGLDSLAGMELRQKLQVCLGPDGEERRKRHTHIHTHAHTQRDREREREGESEGGEG
jgi:hypothetical protein